VRRIQIFAATVTLLLAACSDSNDEGGATEASGGSGGTEAELTVSAASSLTEAFAEIGDAFETANPGTTVTFNFGPSDGPGGLRSEPPRDHRAGRQPGRDREPRRPH
jgi:molybdate transport system substrate-binding protein